jgi:protein-S-isoprenylcysteine O-methyltransferase Ste14
LSKEKVLETVGLIINFFSIAGFFFLQFTFDTPFSWPYFNYAGLTLFAAGILLIVMSTSTLLRNRGKGLIDWGIYRFVRHPLYVGAMMLFLSWAFLFPHWYTLLLSFGNIAIVYWFIQQEDRKNVNRFGREYEEYRERVPGVNIVAGIYRSRWKA